MKSPIHPVALLLRAIVACVFPAGVYADLVESKKIIVDSTAYSFNLSPWDSEKVITYNGYQYTTYWDADGTLRFARRRLSDDNLQVISLSSTVTANDGHRNTTIGISPGNGRLHISYDHHANVLHYRVTSANFLTSPPTTIAASDFSAEISMIGTEETRVTYPQFFNTNDNTLFFLYRDGVSGNGDHYLNKYNSGTNTWSRVGKLFSAAGTHTESGCTSGSTSRNAYNNDIIVDLNNRIHLTWVFRETLNNFNQNNNHGIYYAYSDDSGVTWKNNAGTQIANLGGSDPIAITDTGIRVVTVPCSSFLHNSDAMVVDSNNQPHIVTQKTTNGQVLEAADIQYHHFRRNTNGTWSTGMISAKSVAPSNPFVMPRGTLMIDEFDNLYFLTNFEGFKVWKASASNSWATWTEQGLLSGYTGEGFRYDRRRWEGSSIITVPMVHRTNNAYQLVEYTVGTAPADIVHGGFDTSGNFESWTVSGATATVSEGLLNLVFTGNTPYAQKTSLSINAAQQRYIKIRTRNIATATGGKIWFTTTGNSTWSLSAPLTYVANDLFYRYYVVDMFANNSAWTGTVTGLRVGLESATPGHKLNIDFVTTSNTGWAEHGDFIAGEFNVSGETDRWVYTNATANYTGGKVDLTFTSADPRMQKNGIYVNSDTHRYVKIRMKNNTANTIGRVFFITESDTTWNTTKSLTFNVVANDTVYRTYVVDMGTVGGWTKRIVGLRLDPIEVGAASGQTVSIDHVLVSSSGSNDGLTGIGRIGSVFLSTQADVLGSFNTSGDTEGWTPSQLTQSVANGVNTLTFTGVGPYIRKSGLGLDASKVGTIHVNMKNSTSITTGAVFFITETDPTWNAAKQVQFTITANDTRFKNYGVVMTGNSAWTGKIIGVRVDPCLGATSGSVQVDQIRTGQ